MNCAICNSRPATHWVAADSFLERAQARCDVCMPNHEKHKRELAFARDAIERLSFANANQVKLLEQLTAERDEARAIAEQAREEHINDAWTIKLPWEEPVGERARRERERRRG